MDQFLLNLVQWGLPMGVANMAPVFIKGKMPIDFGKEWSGKRILGKGKTWEGLVGGVAIGTLVGLLLGNWQLGFMVSFGALLGDMIKSFAKRRVGIESGQSWWGFDQTDYVIGGILLGSLVRTPTLWLIVLLFVILVPAHPLVNYIGYLLKVKKNKF